MRTVLYLAVLSLVKMGNQASTNSNRYFSSSEMLSIIQDKEWEILRKQLNKCTSNNVSPRKNNDKLGYIDYAIFVKILQAHFDYMVCFRLSLLLVFIV